MRVPERQAHWENVYLTKGERDVSWFEESPTISLDLIHATGAKPDASIIDIGGGTSRLVDTLLDEGFKVITVLDISEAALATSKARLGARGAHVQWVVADITTWEPSQTYDVWHDRAVLHFLTDPKDRAAYAERVLRAVRPAAMLSSGHSLQMVPNGAADYPWFVTMPLRSVNYSVPRSRWLRAAITPIKRQRAPRNGSNSANFAASGEGCPDIAFFWRWVAAAVYSAGTGNR